MNDNGQIKMVFGGDLLLSRRLSIYKEKEYIELRNLFRKAEVGFANLESVVVDYGIGFHNISKGTFMTTEPLFLRDIKWFGINLMSCANNHSTDWGEQGLLASIQNLKAAEISYAGIGKNYGKAAAPCYLDTPKGRVALISATSTFNEWEIATNNSTLLQGKPGINPLGFKTLYIVDDHVFEALKELGTGLGFETEKKRWKNLGIFTPEEIGIGTETEYTFLGKHFIKGNSFGIRTIAFERHVEENIRQIREARRQADWVVFSLHNHEFGRETKFTKEVLSELTEPAEFMVNFAHQAIDEGVDVFVGHGPHIPLGIEVYKGKPIFYSLGNFINEYDTIRYLPAYAYERFKLDHYATPADFFYARSYGNQKDVPADPLYWESIVAVCFFNKGSLEKITIYPLDLGFGKPRSQRGRAVIAGSMLGEKILGRMAQLSKTLGTQMTIIGNQGEIYSNK